MIVRKCDSCGREVSGKREDPAADFQWYGNSPDPSKPRLVDDTRRGETIKKVPLVQYHHQFEFCVDCSKRITETIAEALLMELTALYGVEAIEQHHAHALIKGELERRRGIAEEEPDDNDPF